MLTEKSKQVIANLARYPPVQDKFETPTRSAILVVLLANEEGDLEVLLTLRSSKLRTNAGDAACPGGKMDPEDQDLKATALREAQEEVGLDPSECNILTMLSPVLSRHLLVVTPVVCFCPNMTTKDIHRLRPNPGEVSAIFTVPLETFLRPAAGTYDYFDMTWLNSNHRVHRFQHCGGHNFLLEPEYTLDPTEHKGWPVFGMTAEVMIGVARIGYGAEPSFEKTAPDQVNDLDLLTHWYNKNQPHADRHRL